MITRDQVQEWIDEWKAIESEDRPTREDFVREKLLEADISGETLEPDGSTIPTVDKILGALDTYA